MKRLIKKAFGTTLYHGTELYNLKKITEMGMIVPQESFGGGISDDLVDEMIDNRMKEDGLGSEDYDDFYSDYHDTIMEEEKAKYEGYTFFSNDMNRAKFYCNANPLIVIEINISEDALLPDDNDCPDCKNWQESLQRTKQVKVLGNITEDYIIGVYIFKDRDDKGQFFPKLTWINEYKENKE